MKRELFELLENEMLKQMAPCDGAHDSEHVRRVLSMALVLAGDYAADMDVLIASAFFHDIGRPLENLDETVDHAVIGADMAYDFLMNHGFCPEKARHVRECIKSHRVQNAYSPQTIEAKILFDADKLDLTGTMAVARAIIVGEHFNEPLYTRSHDGGISDGTNEGEISFLGFYNKRLSKTADGLFTPRAKKIAANRQTVVESFYVNMLSEIVEFDHMGQNVLNCLIDEHGGEMD